MKTRIPALILAASAAFTTAAFAQTEAPADAASVQSLTQDQLIKREVIDRITADDHLSGRVGVEIDKGTVTLTGSVLDPNQIEWTEEDALSVDGVKDVINLVSAKVGAY